MIDTPESVAVEDEGPATTVASLEIRGFEGSPDAITEILGLLPTRTGRADDAYRNSAGRVTNRIIELSYWSLRSRADLRGSINEHVTDLLDQVRESFAAFSRLPAGMSICVRCTIIPNGYLPLFELDASTLRSLGEIGAAFELDIFSVSGRSEIDNTGA